MAEAYGNLIDGEWRPARNGKTFDDRNPADTRDVVGRLAASDAQDVDDAVEAAAKGLSGWVGMPAPVRGRYLRGVARARGAARRGPDLLSPRGRRQDDRRSKGRGHAGGPDPRVLRRGGFAARGKVCLPSASEISRNRAPAGGAVALVAPWNFPSRGPRLEDRPALVCGNTVGFKPASQAPADGGTPGQDPCRAGLPKGALNW